MQAFLWRQLVGRKETLVAVTDPVGMDIRASLGAGEVFRIPSGGECVLKMKEARGRSFGADMVMVLAAPVDGLLLRKSEVSRDGSSMNLTFQAEGAKLPPGKKGTIIITTQSGYNNKTPYSVSPAVPFEVVAPEGD
jgi:hypothetical protein